MVVVIHKIGIHFLSTLAIDPIAWKAFDGQKILDYSADESWGPKIDGTLHRSAASWQQGPGEQFGQLTPYVANPNNVKDFFDKPISNNTNFSFSKGGDNYQSRISYTHIDTKGIIPNSSQMRDFVSAKNTYNFTSKFSSTLDITYSATRSKNVPADNYGSSGGTNSLVGELLVLHFRDITKRLGLSTSGFNVS
ncbi:MAG: hypothetical protein U5N85_21290 [Arcicella sp.]|nr:hypothetical protein [Arcicella sp.]